MNKLHYKMSFTAGALLLNECNVVVENYLKCKDWIKTKEIVLSKNLLQTRMNSTLVRYLNECIKRLKMLTEDQLIFFSKATIKDQISILWVAICAHYRFIADFAIEVIREKYLRYDYELSHKDFDVFFNDKSQWHSELEKLKPATIKKIKQNLFRILREVEIIDNSKLILGTTFSQDLYRIIEKSGKGSLAIFPYRTAF